MQPIRTEERTILRRETHRGWTLTLEAWDSDQALGTWRARHPDHSREFYAYPLADLKREIDRYENQTVPTRGAYRG